MTTPAPDPYVPRVAHVWDTRVETAGVRTVDLVVAGRDPLPAFAPGQFAMLYAFGVGEAAISFSGDPTGHTCITHTIRRAGAVSGALAALQPGDPVGLRGPFGRGWPMDQIVGRDFVVVAGGLGLAPLRPAILQALRPDAGADRIVLLYGARNPDLILYREELADWAEQGMEVRVTVDHADADWRGEVGLVTNLVARAAFDPRNTVAFVCGPEVMMRFSACTLLDAGVPAQRIWVSMERNMKCAIGHCGHCQFGADFVCKDGPVFRFDAVRTRLFRREI